MEQKKQSNSKFIKSKKTFFAEEAVQPFTISDEEDSDYSDGEQQVRKDMVSRRKGKKKQAPSLGSKRIDAYSRSRSMHGSSKYADSDCDDDNDGRRNNTNVVDDDTKVIAFSFSDDEDNIFEEENKKFSCKRSPQKRSKVWKEKKVEKRCRSKSSDNESSDVQEDSDSSPASLFEMESPKQQFFNKQDNKNTRTSPSKIADMVYDDVFDDLSSDEDCDNDKNFKGPRTTTVTKVLQRGGNGTFSSSSANNVQESKTEVKERSPKRLGVDKKQMKNHSSLPTDETKMMEMEENDEKRSNLASVLEKNVKATNLSHSENFAEIYKYGYCRRDNQLTRCVLRRTYLGFGKVQPVFVLYIQDSNRINEIPILGAQKKVSCKTPNFHIFDVSPNFKNPKSAVDLTKGFSKKDGNYVGKLRGNKSNQFTLFGSELHRQPYCAMHFNETKRFIAKKHSKPRSIKVLLPILSEKGRVSRSMISSKPMLEALKEKIDNGDIKNSAEHKDDFILLANKLPQFTRGSYRLNFGGRVRTASIKNFQLCSTDSVHLNTSLDSKIPNDVILQMGKYSKDKFHVDFKYPMTAFQALGVCLSQFAKKS